MVENKKEIYSGMAITSTILSVLSLILSLQISPKIIGISIAIISIIFGFIGLSTIKRNGKKGKIIAIIGILIGVLAIILAFLFPIVTPIR